MINQVLRWLRLTAVVAIASMIYGCSNSKKENVVIELSYENCKAMLSDKKHPYWNQPIAVQGCEMVVFDAEMGDGNKSLPPMDLEGSPEDNQL